MTDIRKKLRFYGRVQGVGFRYRARQLAGSLGLTGWVRNEYDGSVAMEVQGSPARIDRLLMGINQDMYIRIDWIDSEEISLKQESGFQVQRF